ncbi:hypothetical protein NDU88_001694 [Pleurodeles waltl]|uniref:Reverse transcriptase RNase H-like domain-containing protein n=1 Tax=Pleurodeles waltl TaxID=8319 RepID=A0AAV7U761_PLEWA|nr:hypothetical protein NDU88_001694 [Pleurodeles waltl]
MALKSTNATCILGRYIYALMNEAKMHSALPQEVLNLLADAQVAAAQVIQSGLDTSDSVARAMGTSIATRQHAWLRSSGFSPDVQATLLDLPFDGDKLFGAKADSALERFKESSFGVERRRLDGVCRLAECLLSYHDPQVAQEVSPVCGGVATLSVCGPSIWSYFGTSSLHKGDGGGCSRAQKKGDSSIPLYGRLVDQSQVSGAPAASPAVDNSVVRSGLFGKRAQISPGALSAPPVLRGSTGHNIESGLSSTAADSGHSGIDSYVPEWSGRSSPQGPSLLGLFASCILLVTHAHWHMRSIQWCIRRQWFQHKGDLEESIKISRDAAADLQWWAADGNLSQGKPFPLPPPVATVITDASTLGWGAHLGDLEVKGHWSPGEQRLHINLLELRAIRLALKAFLPSLRGRSVQVLTNNTTAMWYINKQGGVWSYLLCREALRLWSWVQDHRICLVANHLAGVLTCVRTISVSKSRPITNGVFIQTWSFTSSRCGGIYR